MTDPSNPPTVTAAVARKRLDAGLIGLAWVITVAFSLAHDGHWPRVVLGNVLMATFWSVAFLGRWDDAPKLTALEQAAVPLPTGVPVQPLRSYAVRAVGWLIPIVAVYVALDVLLGPAGSVSGILAGMVIVKLAHGTRFRRFEERSRKRLLYGAVGRSRRVHSFYYVPSA